MKNVNSSIENEIISLNQDIALCESFTEKQMQAHFNTDDTKEEFMALLQEELAFYMKEAESEESHTSPEVDEGFADNQDYINYKYL